MNSKINHIVQLLLVSYMLLVAAVPCLAAEVRRVPGSKMVEQGILSLTLDVEGAEDFRYSGLEDKWHTYRGKIKAGDNLKFDIRVKLADKKTLPVTERSCTMRAEVVAKKGSQVIEKKNFKSDNKINVFFKYTVPEGTDTLEVSEVFVLNNKSKEEKFNQKSTTQNKLILTTKDVQPAAGVTKGNDNSGEKKDKNINEKGDKKDTGKETDKKGNGEKGDSSGKEGSKGTGTESGKKSTSQMIAGAAAVLLLAGVGGYFFMKNRRENQAVAERAARKEKLRQQAIQRQQEMQQQNLQQRQEEVDQRNAMQEEKRMRQQEEQRHQEVLREQETQSQQAMREAKQRADVNQQVQQPMEQNLPPQGQNPVPPQAGAAGMVGAATMENAIAEQKHFCQNCGAPLKPGTRFCENCGAKV